MIRLFYFIACMGNNWDAVVKSQLNVIEASGLYADVDAIYVCVATNNRGKDVRLVRRMLPKKAKIVYYSHLTQYELPALHMIKEYTKPEDQILYLHTKAVSKEGKQRTAGDKWREYLDWGCIENYKAHLEALKTHDISGVQLTRLDNRFTKLCGSKVVYAGNYFWANGDYIQKLEAPEIGKNRWIAEGWGFGANPKAYDFHNLTNGKMITTHNTFSLCKFNRGVYDPNYVEKVIPEMLHYKYDAINILIEKFKYKKYLEIGYFQGQNFKKIKCDTKISVDPFVNGVTFKLTSDDFFEQNKEKFDIILIDGYHECRQVLRDIENSLACLNEGGTIVTHDNLPQTKLEGQYLEDFPGGFVWCGDVYKAWAKLRMTRPDLSMHVLDLDFGVGVIRKGKQITHPQHDIDFKYYIQNRKSLMNIVDPEDAEKFLRGLR